MPGGPNDLVMLGTASQMPSRERNHVGMVLRLEGATVLIDPGEGTQRQLLHTDRTVTALDAVCLTHLHGDHCLGLPGVLQSRAQERRDELLPLLFPAPSRDDLEHLLRAGLTSQPLPVRPIPVPGDGPVGEVAGLQVEAAVLDHPVPTVGWRFETPHRRHLLPDALDALGLEGPAVGELVRAGQITVHGRTVRMEDVSVHRPGFVVAVVLDTRLCDAAFALARDADLLVCESTFLAADTDLAEAYGHLTSTQAAAIARDAGARRLVLTHYSNRYPDEAEFAAEAAAVFPDVVAARDFDVVTFTRAPDVDDRPGRAGVPHD